MNYINYINNVDSTWARRAFIVFFVVCAIPVISVVLLAEVIWKTIKYMAVMVKTVIRETIPIVQSYIDAIKEIW